MSTYDVPVFVQPGWDHTRLTNPTVGSTRTLPDSIAAAIRWDYEHGMMPMRDLAYKWRKHASRRTVECIAYGQTYRDVQAAQGEP